MTLSHQLATASDTLAAAVIHGPPPTADDLRRLAIMLAAWAELVEPLEAMRDADKAAAQMAAIIKPS